ncbi:MAG: ATP-grasp domain-containing protein [Bacteroidales bacterium]|nr:ATP-grasp domain-containing protein [Bacteroidales bacterium]
MKQKVVIIGHGYTSRLGMIRALGMAGYEVIVIVMTWYKRDGKTLDTSKPIDCYSKYVSRYLFNLASDTEGLIGLLLRECVDSNQKVVVIPDSDVSAAAIDMNQDKLSPYFLFPHINKEQGAVVDWMDKTRQKTHASECGLTVAKSWTIHVVGGEYTIPNNLQYPCFPKPLATIVGGKGGLKRCNNEPELREVIAMLVQKKPTIDIMAEEFRNIQTEYAVLGFSDGKDVVIPGILEILSMANGGHFGVAKQGKIMPVQGYEELVEKFKDFVGRIGFVGIFDIDFYKSDGELFFGELNLRYGGSGYAVTASGVNLPEMLVKTLLGQSIESLSKQVTKTLIYCNERMCADDWYGGYIGTVQFKKLLQSANISFIDDRDDEAPRKAFRREKCDMIKNMKRIVKRLLIKR